MGKSSRLVDDPEAPVLISSLSTLVHPADAAVLALCLQQPLEGNNSVEWLSPVHRLEQGIGLSCD